MGRRRSASSRRLQGFHAHRTGACRWRLQRMRSQRVGGSSCTWENGCCTQRPRARECRQASSLRPTAAAICARRGNESAAPLAASLWTRALSLPIFCSERQLQASGEWLRYLSFVYLPGTLSFPIDTRPFTMFYPGPLLPSAVASATQHSTK